VAWLILGQAPPDSAIIARAQQDHPQLAGALERVQTARSSDLANYRLRSLVAEHPELKAILRPDIDIEAVKRMAENDIKRRLERVKGISTADLVGGREDELQVIVDPQQLAARNLTIDDLRAALANQNKDTSGGDVWEGKRRYVVRTLGQFRSPKQVEGVIITRRDGKPVYVRDVATVQLGTKKPQGVVRRFGSRNIAIKITRRTCSSTPVNSAAWSTPWSMGRTPPITFSGATESISSSRETNDLSSGPRISGRCRW